MPASRLQSNTHSSTPGTASGRRTTRRCSTSPSRSPSEPRTREEVIHETDSDHAVGNGLSDDVINQAQEQHQKAHVLREWWTAENSGGFHNPDAARLSLTTSVEEARKGITIVSDALLAKMAAPRAADQDTPSLPRSAAAKSRRPFGRGRSVRNRR
ncbi:MAG: ammonia-forming cytochrome c nitrite reductase subunit c552 [Acidobacteria bacterium]|nr:ammonia-forming cytochrome c nitrite reductase subunit c552 [Acidobacteriota bacterium]